VLATGYYDWESPGLDAYSEYGEHHDKCPFCDAPSDTKFPFKVYERINRHQIKDQLIFLCIDHWNKYQAFSQSGQDTESSITNPRLGNFVRTSLLPQDAIDYAVYRKNPFHCVFCKQQITNNNNSYETLTIEQGKYDTIEGDVPVCNTCSILVEHHSKFSTADNCGIKMDKCHDCGESYPIINHEYYSRDLNKTLGRHSCSVCLDNRFDLIGKSRFIEAKCETENCENTTWIDLTLSPEFKTYVCSQCLQEHHEEHGNFCYTFGESEEILLHIGWERKNNKKLWTYTVQDNKTKKILYSSEEMKERFNSVEDAVFMGTLQAQTYVELLYPTNQLNIF
jgi:hypothetical protein